MPKCPSASEGNCTRVVIFVVVFPPVVFDVVIITIIVLVTKATIEILPLQGILKHSSNTHTLVAL